MHLCAALGAKHTIRHVKATLLQRGAHTLTASDATYKHYHSVVSLVSQAPDPEAGSVASRMLEVGEASTTDLRNARKRAMPTNSQQCYSALISGLNCTLTAQRAAHGAGPINQVLGNNCRCNSGTIARKPSVLKFDP